MAAAEDLNWSIQVEDLVDNGDTKGAISLLESVVNKLETLNLSSSSSSIDLKLATALTDLDNLYSTQGFSLKADELQSRSFLLKQKNSHKIKNNDLGKNGVLDTVSACDGSPAPPSDADDWESIADRPIDEILTPPPPVHDIGISKLTLEDSKPETTTTKRRGRGAFMYKKNSLYSDQQTGSVNSECSDDDEVEVGQSNSDEKLKSGIANFGTSHVLVLADFPPSTRTMELEKLFESFRDRGFVIRWVNDTVALAVFKTPSIALEACSNVHASFRIHVLQENDNLLCSISRRDLEPPTPRPKTSVRTAQRLIAQGMGRKLSTETFGSAELRKQEEARKNRIVTRQTLKDEAWGDD
ncbi:hypothetical protein C5167_046949 [Papaver somniferum]|uniref:RRM domain-containing protein n=1 Tax=Papaver somniferum TaxID=3469 RepID=A0A4Y7LF84_PAPSO|nr:uncharacterized protein LOC113322846 [Papaver somniferum]RZC84164.1 hypothetical protein C5167_046949 [Papaver somniferum]